MSRLRPAALITLCLAFLPGRPALPQSTQPDLAARRAAHLRRGVNTSKWFAQSANDYSVQHLRTFTTLDDLALIRSLGFDHIRLSIDPAPLALAQSAPPSNPGFLTELDAVVARATSLQLAVILDIQPESPYKQALLHTPATALPAFVSLWRTLATRYAATDPSLVFFEIMNEPEQTDPARWQAIQTEVARTIREVAPAHTIIASGAHWSGLEDLLQFSPLPLENIIYTFHNYEPFAFTHQGANWTSPQVRTLRGIPYPSTPENIAPLLPLEPTLPFQFWLEQYGLDRWDAARIDHTLAFAELWSRAHHAPVYCGEFGVFQPFASPADRARWLHDTRTALEAHSIGWAMWDYQDSFGLVSKHNGVTTPDPALLDALGLTPGKTAPAPH